MGRQPGPLEIGGGWMAYLTVLLLPVVRGAVPAVTF